MENVWAGEDDNDGRRRLALNIKFEVLQKSRSWNGANPRLHPTISRLDRGPLSKRYSQDKVHQNPDPDLDLSFRLMNLSNDQVSQSLSRARLKDEICEIFVIVNVATLYRTYTSNFFDHSLRTCNI
jgi:hypothetical protein